MRAKSTDREPMLPVILSQSDFVLLVSSQSEGLGKMALGIITYFSDRLSQPIGVSWFAISLSWSVAVDPGQWGIICLLAQTNLNLPQIN